MNFHNLCTVELYNEAKRIIDTKTNWVDGYKSQTLSAVVDKLERGVMIRTTHGGKAMSYKLADISSLVREIERQDDAEFSALGMI